MGSNDTSLSTADRDKEEAARHCHPESHRRRGTSQALNRFRFRSPIYVRSRAGFLR